MRYLILFFLCLPLIGCGTAKITIRDDEIEMKGKAKWELERDEKGQWRKIGGDNQSKPIIQFPQVKVQNNK